MNWNEQTLNGSVHAVIIDETGPCTVSTQTSAYFHTNTEIYSGFNLNELFDPQTQEELEYISHQIESSLTGLQDCAGFRAQGGDPSRMP